MAAYAALFALISLSQVVLVWITPFPPLLDYPNHLARMVVLHDLGDVEAFRAAYEAAWAPLPNLGMEAIVLPLLHVVSPDVAGRIVLSMALLLGHAGCHLVGRAAGGRPPWLALPAMATVLNASFLHGFVSSALGLGLFLLVLGFWLPRRQRRDPAFLGAMTLLAILCFFTHLTAALFLGFAMATLCALDLRARRITLAEAVRSLLPLVVPAVLAVLAPHGDDPALWGTLVVKLRALGWSVRTYGYTADALFVLLLGGAAALAWRPRAPLAAPPLAVIAGLLFLVFAALPDSAYGTWAGDRRFLHAAVILGLLSLRVSAAGRRAAAALALVTCAALVRSGHVAITWRAASRRIAARVALLDTVPEGARIETEGAVHDDRIERYFAHVPLYAVIRRHAVVSSLFTKGGQQPLVELDQRPGDFIWSRAAGEARRRELAARCRSVTAVEEDVLAARCQAMR